MLRAFRTGGCLRDRYTRRANLHEPQRDRAPVFEIATVVAIVIEVRH
jgi:hypothetical protein